MFSIDGRHEVLGLQPVICFVYAAANSKNENGKSRLSCRFYVDDLKFYSLFQGFLGFFQQHVGCLCGKIKITAVFTDHGGDIFENDDGIISLQSEGHMTMLRVAIFTNYTFHNYWFLLVLKSSFHNSGLGS